MIVDIIVTLTAILTVLNLFGLISVSWWVVFLLPPVLAVLLHAGDRLSDYINLKYRSLIK